MMASGFTRIDHVNKSYRYAEGGKVRDEGGSYSGMIPKSLHKLWGMIPSAADIAVTGKISASPEEYEKAREQKERDIERRKKEK
jgi:hypothetical protein